MKNLFISQPIRGGRTDEEILTERNLIISLVKDIYHNEEIKILNSYFPDYDGNALGVLGKSIEVLSKSDIAAFGAGWENARGCRIEHQCCEDYGIEIIEL